MGPLIPIVVCYIFDMSNFFKFFNYKLFCNDLKMYAKDVYSNDDFSLIQDDLNRLCSNILMGLSAFIFKRLT